MRLPKRFYCVNKSSEVWAKEFSQEERQDQSRVLNPKHENDKYKFPNICFLVSSRKTRSLQFFYPVLTQLKTDSPPCFKLPCSKSLHMSTCTCPKDAANDECNRQSIYSALIYDNNIADNRARENADVTIINDRAVRFGLEMQRKIAKNMTLDPGLWTNPPDMDDVRYDEWAMDYFSAMFEATMLASRNPLGANLTRSAPDSASANEQLRKAWGKLGDGLSAVVLRTLGIEGGTNFVLPINRFNVQLSDLAKNKSATFQDPRMNDTKFQAAMCQGAN